MPSDDDNSVACRVYQVVYAHFFLALRTFVRQKKSSHPPPFVAQQNSNTTSADKKSTENIRIYIYTFVEVETAQWG